MGQFCLLILCLLNNIRLGHIEGALGSQKAVIFEGHLFLLFPFLFAELTAVQSIVPTADPADEWQNYVLCNEPKLINMVCEPRWNFSKYWREVFCNLMSTETRTELAFPSPEGEIAELEHQMSMHKWSLSECFRAVLGKWMEAFSPTAGDLHGVLSTQGLGERAKSCLEKYAELKKASESSK